jgi:5,10-methylenetetrahydrofolate reductase
MSRSFAEALRDRPLLFEPVPPSARAAPARAEASANDIARMIVDLPRVDAVDVPELVDENHDGRPYYRSGDTRTFARRLSDSTGRPVIVNKVVAHLASTDAVASWGRETVQRGITNVVLVGGSSRYIPYPGPTVVEADRILAPILTAPEGVLGNIAIPQRTGEPHRMLQKTRAGARFFTTQIVFDDESVLRMVREYDRLCRQGGVTPAPVLISVAPIGDEGDAEFVRWLGADIPEAAERSILGGDDALAGTRSIERALQVYRGVRDGARSEGIEVSLGVNVEQISPRHLGNAAEMLRAFSQAIDEAPVEPAHLLGRAI